MFQHFGQRLKRDLKQIVDRRLENIAVQSGSQARVCFICLTVFIACTDNYTSPLELKWTSSLTSVNGASFPYIGWFGGTFILHQIRGLVWWISHGVSGELCRDSTCV